MGRHPLYQTEQERKQAKKERDRNMGRTPRGKELRSQQNRRAYERRRGPIKRNLRLPYIPKYVETLSKLEMNLSSDLLLKNFNGGAAFSDEAEHDKEFLHWDLPPPYQVSSNLVLDVGLDDTKDALHGRRMRLQHLSELALVQQYEDTNDHDEVWCSVHRELVHQLLAFPKLQKTVLSFRYESQMDYEMGRHLLQWKAYSIMELKAYWIALKGRRKGAVQEVYERKWDAE